MARHESLSAERLTDDDELEMALGAGGHIVAVTLVDDIEAHWRQGVDHEIMNRLGCRHVGLELFQGNRVDYKVLSTMSTRRENALRSTLGDKSCDTTPPSCRRALANMPSLLPVTNSTMDLPGRLVHERVCAEQPAAGNGKQGSLFLVLALATSALTGGCASSGDTPPTTEPFVLAQAPDDSATDTRPTPSDAYLSGIANGALSGSGNVRVQLVDGVAYVTGRCESAIDESAILRKLRSEPGVERIENRLQRNM